MKIFCGSGVILCINLAPSPSIRNELICVMFKGGYFIWGNQVYLGLSPFDNTTVPMSVSARAKVGGTKSNPMIKAKHIVDTGTKKMSIKLIEPSASNNTGFVIRFVLQIGYAHSAFTLWLMQASGRYSSIGFLFAHIFSIECHLYKNNAMQKKPISSKNSKYR